MSKRSRRYFEAFNEFQSQCEKHSVTTPPPPKRRKLSDLNDLDSNQNLREQTPPNQIIKSPLSDPNSKSQAPPPLMTRKQFDEPPPMEIDSKSSASSNSGRRPLRERIFLMADSGPKSKRTGARKRWRGFGKKRVETLRHVIVQNGGTVIDSLTADLPQSAVMVVVSERIKRGDFDTMFSAEMQNDGRFNFVTPDFITFSAESRRRLSPSRFAPNCLTETAPDFTPKDGGGSLVTLQSVDAAPIYHDDDERDTGTTTEDGIEGKRKRKGPIREQFACQIENDGLGVNRNEAITRILDEMSSFYEFLGDEWRCFSYKKASGFIKRFGRKIESRSDVEELSKTKGFSAKFGAKVLEIMRTGTLRKYDELRSMPQIEAISAFSSIFGVGPKTARKWYNLGLRTVDDLRSGRCGVSLDRRQQIGLKYHEDLSAKIPRAEVIEMEEVVRREVEALCPGTTVMIAGSFRRGKAQCGDVDVLITHSVESRTEGLLLRIVERLKEIGFIVDDLSAPSGRGDHPQQSYMGVCRLNDGHELGRRRLHRHVDIKVYRPQHFAFAVLYFTGSDHFNRSMRLFAKKKGFTLSDTMLAPAVRCGKTKILTVESKAIRCKTERDIFSALSLRYIEPTMRNTYESFGSAMELDEATRPNDTHSLSNRKREKGPNDDGDGTP